jgi:hypothetical protein
MVRTNVKDVARELVLTTGYSDAAQAAPPDLKILQKPFDTDTLRDFVQNIGKVSLPN